MTDGARMDIMHRIRVLRGTREGCWARSESELARMGEIDAEIDRLLTRLDNPEAVCRWCGTRMPARPVCLANVHGDGRACEPYKDGYTPWYRAGAFSLWARACAEQVGFEWVAVAEREGGK